LVPAKKALYTPDGGSDTRRPAPGLQ
jgi:hypothetical protein